MAQRRAAAIGSIHVQVPWLHADGLSAAPPTGRGIKAGEGVKARKLQQSEPATANTVTVKCRESHGDDEPQRQRREKIIDEREHAPAQAGVVRCEGVCAILHAQENTGQVIV